MSIARELWKRASAIGTAETANRIEERQARERRDAALVAHRNGRNQSASDRAPKQFGRTAVVDHRCAIEVDLIGPGEVRAYPTLQDIGRRFGPDHSAAGWT